jgi:2-iminobutanoate/2-iminopropanoate deaminase
VKEITTEKAPKPIGPYVQAVVAHGFVFVSGQIPLDPQTGEIVEGGTAEQTERVLTNLSAILEAAGSSLDRTVKMSVFITDLNDFPVVNKVYAGHFKTRVPARSTIEAARLPRGVRVEIDAIAIVAD